MTDNEQFIEEDWERESLKDSIYIEEKRREIEEEYWEWLRGQPGNIIVEKVEEDLTLYDEVLPF